VPTSLVPPLAPAEPSTPADRTWTLLSPEGSVDVEVRAPEDAVLADVVDALSDGLGLPGAALWAGSTALGPDTPLTDPALRHGAVLGLGRPGPRTTSGTGSGALELHLAGGPDAGRSVALGQGALVVGRGGGCGLQVVDPDVSRQHAVVEVAGGRVTVADLESSNGTWLVDGQGPPRPVGPDPCEWPVGAALRLGASVLRLTGPRGATLEQRPAPGGRTLVRPLVLPPRAPRTVVVELPAPPVAEARRRLGWVAVAVPAAGGLVMAWLLATPQFLFFALLSPLVAVAGWLSDRVTGRRTHRRALRAHAVERALAEQELDAAVSDDLADQEERHPDLARLAAAARRRSSPLWSCPAELGGLPLRVGSGAGPTTVTRLESGGSRSTVPADAAPVVVPLAGCGSLGVVGPRPAALGVARALLCQLAVLASPEQVDVVVCCPAERAAEWSWARWLPHLRVVLLPGQHPPAGLVDADAGRTTVLMLDGPADPAVVELLARPSGRLLRLDVAGSEAGLALPVVARLEVTGETGTTGRLRLPGAEVERMLTLDVAGRETAAAIARDLAPLVVPADHGGLPATARLLDLPTTTGLRVGVAAEGSWDRDRGRLLAVLGSDAHRPRHVDLVSDGPHALVAGTTGSGKSELLQTLVASLALHHPPDRCSFLLVDYKGGAAFGAAATLPHTVGVLTDLDSSSTARALRSLTAELTRRERLLAEHGARDLRDLPDTVAASRLVIVVDEFATLAEELPDFVQGLVGIAQRGRSLGVHLVLATQRPGGVVSPEIRANCSLRICLRTTDEGDARDVLGSTAPAHLPPDRPGRAYLRTGSAPPVLFQVARVSSAPVRSGPVVVAARRRAWPAAPAAFPVAAGAAGDETDLERVVAALRARAATERLSAPHRPWLPPLPDHLGAADLDRWTPGASPALLALGLVDVPDQQTQSLLTLDLAAGGGQLLVGGPRSGRTTALRTVLTEAVRRLPPTGLHVHVLDHGGGALTAEAAALAHCGTAVDRSDPHRSLRLLARLGEEVDRRRGRGSAGDEPLLLLLVDGYESLVAQLDEADPATGGAALLRLVRDGAAVGVTVVLTAERAVPGSRVAAAVRRRLVLPLPDRADYAVAGVPPRSVPGHRPPGRALVGEDAVECQLALPRAPVGPQQDHPDPVAVRVVVLPPDPQLLLPGPLPARDGLWLPVGPGGDDGTAVGVDLRRTGGLLVLGPPGSGRSSALAAFARHCAATGAGVVQLTARPPGPPAAVSDPDRLDRADAAGLRRWLAEHAGRHPAVVVVDDLPTLPEAVGDVLGDVLAGAGDGPLVLASGTAAEVAGSFRGPAVALRRSRTVLLLQPTAGDAELLGLRTPRTPAPPRPGAGWLLTPARTTRVQVARRRTPVASGG